VLKTLYGRTILSRTSAGLFATNELNLDIAWRTPVPASATEWRQAPSGQSAASVTRSLQVIRICYEPHGPQLLMAF
jgi:hypothetical protein